MGEGLPAFVPLFPAWRCGPWGSAASSFPFSVCPRVSAQGLRIHPHPTPTPVCGPLRPDRVWAEKRAGIFHSASPSQLEAGRFGAPYCPPSLPLLSTWSAAGRCSRAATEACTSWDQGGVRLWGLTGLASGPLGSVLRTGRVRCPPAAFLLPSHSVGTCARLSLHSAPPPSSLCPSLPACRCFNVMCGSLRRVCVWCRRSFVELQLFQRL